VLIGRKRSGSKADQTESDGNDFFHGIASVMKNVAAIATPSTIR
jgi:hypothetical protein